MHSATFSRRCQRLSARGGGARAPQHAVLLAATVLLVVRNAALVDAPSAGWTHGSPWIWTHFQRYEPEPEPDPIGFGRRRGRAERASAAEAPSTAVKPRSPGALPADARRRACSGREPADGAGEQPAGAAHAGAAGPCGQHACRPRVAAVGPAPPARIDFEVPAADGDPAAAAAAGAAAAGAGAVASPGTPERCAWDPPPPEPVAAPPEAPRPWTAARPSSTASRRLSSTPSTARRPANPTAAPPDDRARPDGDARGAAAVDTSPTRTFLLTVRVSNTSDGGGARTAAQARPL